jgi:hypothetical protein
MKKIVLTLALGFLAVGPTTAQQTHNWVNGSVWNGENQMTRVELPTVKGMPAKIVLADGKSLEVEGTSEGGSLIRLYGQDGRKLHESVGGALVGGTKSFRYVICGNDVTYASPEPSESPACSGG